MPQLDVDLFDDFITFALLAFLFVSDIEGEAEEGVARGQRDSLAVNGHLGL
jgi:hypothetical protein